MALKKREYIDQETVITAENLNEIQEAVIALEDGLFSMDNEKSGEVITITDAAKRSFRGLNIYGKTIQDGTPTPDAPVDLVNIGSSGSITVNVNGENEAQSITIVTPNGLPGIPVSSGGNYTDANGQQWICDEVDFAKGAFIKRVGGVVLTGSDAWAFQENALYFYIPIHDRKPGTNLWCDRLPHIRLLSTEVPGWWADDTSNKIFAAAGFVKSGVATTLEEFKVYLAEHPFKLLYILDVAIETPLSNDELAGYAALHTYKDHTQVSNDAGAWMDLEYAMDAKKYIDGLAFGTGSTMHQATVE